MVDRQAIRLDWLVGGSSVVGLMIGAAATDLEDPFMAEAKTSFYLIGAYAAQGFASGVQIDGYLARSAVDYEVGATEFETRRTLAGFDSDPRHYRLYGNHAAACPRVRFLGGFSSGNWRRHRRHK
jgi:hypothetical protein